MTRTTKIAVCAYLIVFSALAAAAREPYRIAAPAAWVTVAAPPHADESAPVEQGQSDFLLVDQQVRVGSVTERYMRYVERLVSQESVDAGAQLSFEFDPGHERVTVHEVRVRRDGRTIDKLADSRRSLLNRETGLADGLIDGRVTLHMLLQDIRVGDTLDYSYTVERRDPIAERAYNDWYATQWGVPVRHFRLRVLNAEQRPLQARDFGKLGEPETRREGGWIVRTWEAHDLVALPNEKSRPSWYFMYPRIELTEFADWGTVRAWAQPLYAVPPGNDAQLRALIADIATGHDESARILRALRFVQDDVRYTGIEIGAGAYRPTPPTTVLARRFGDCKDKVLLFITVLRELGIEAYPALVHSSIGRGLAERAPGPGAFNHVIAKVRSKGRDYWLDATATGQGGNLESVVQADYGLALVIAPGVTELEKIPTVSSDTPTIQVTEVYDFRKGTGKTAAFSVTTQYRDDAADSMRATLRRKTTSKLGTEYQDYYHKRYAGLRGMKPLVVSDDRERNVIVVEENYEIDTPFRPEHGKREFALEAYLISERTGKPEQTLRTTPLARDFPVHVHHQITAYLPGHWNIKPDEVEIANEAFSYHSTARFQDDRFELDYRLRHTSDHVKLEALPGFLKHLERAHDDAFYTLTDGGVATAAAMKLSSAFALSTLVGLAIGGWLFVYLWQLNAPLPSPDPGAPVGLGGWMILPAIGSVCAPFVLSWAWFKWAQAVGTEAAFTRQPEDMQYLVLALGAALSAMFVASVVQVVLLFQRRNSFPRAFIIGDAAALVVSILAFLIVTIRDEPAGKAYYREIGELVKSFLVAAIWISYALVSRRVRATFIVGPRFHASTFGLK